MYECIIQCTCTYLPGDVRRGNPESVRRELGHRGLGVVSAVHEHVCRVGHVSHHDELPTRVNDLGLLWVSAQDEVVPPLRRRVRCPVGKEGGVAHARCDVARHGGRKVRMSSWLSVPAVERKREGRAESIH